MHIHTHTLSSPLTRQSRRTALLRQQRIRTILEQLPELFRSLEIDLLEQLLQHRRGPGQARRRRAAGQTRHDDGLRVPSAFHLGSPRSSLSRFPPVCVCARERERPWPRRIRSGVRARAVVPLEGPAARLENRSGDDDGRRAMTGMTSRRFHLVIESRINRSKRETASAT